MTAPEESKVSIKRVREQGWSLRKFLSFHTGVGFVAGVKIVYILFLLLTRRGKEKLSTARHHNPRKPFFSLDGQASFILRIFTELFDLPSI